MRKRVGSKIVIGLMAIALILSVNTAQAADEKKILLKVPVCFATALPGLGTTITWMADRLETASDGSLKMKVFEPGKLGTLQIVAFTGFGSHIHGRKSFATQNVIQFPNLYETISARRSIAGGFNLFEIRKGYHIAVIIDHECAAVFADLTTVYPQRQRPKGEVETFSAKVQAVEATETIDIATEDFGSVLLRFEGGAKATMFVSQTTAGRKNALRYEIAGSKGALAWNGERPNEMWLGHRNEANQLLFRDPGLVSEVARNFIGYPGGHSEGYDDTFKMCFKDYYTYLAAGDFGAPQPFPTLEEGHYEILLCEAILKSHQEQKWVNVGE